MTASSLTARKDRYILVIIDFIALYGALLLALLIRYDGSFTPHIFSLHAFPFTVISLFSILAYYVAGLYERDALYSLKKSASRLLNAEIAVVIGSVLFFYLYSSSTITPKTTLTLYIVFAYLLVFLIRFIRVRFLSRPSPISAILVASGMEADELFAAAMNDSALGMRFSKRIDPADPALETLVKEAVQRDNPSVIVIDNGHPAMAKILPSLYELIFSAKHFIDIQALYEEVFERVPLSLVRYEWFLEHASRARSQAYEIVRRIVEIILALIVLVPTVIVMPFVWVAVKLDDGGPLFFIQERVGRRNKPVRIRKFRSMQRNEHDVWLAESTNQVTRVGRFLRKTRIDELPQVVSVLKGDISLIGPRSDIIGLWKRLEKELPFYSVRTLVTPGLSGWAQIKQDKVPQTLEETRERLSYDLYYVKNRSLVLDLAIALRTIATLLSRRGM